MASRLFSLSRERTFWLAGLLLTTLTCLLGYSYLSPAILGGERIASLSSPWSGEVTRPDGRLKVAGNQAINVISLPVRLVRNASYEFSLSAVSSRPLHVDFFASGYDNPAQEVVLSAPFDRIETHRFSFNSGKCPEAASLRIFFEGPAEVELEHFSAVRTTSFYRCVRLLLLVVPIGLWCFFRRRVLRPDQEIPLILGAIVFAVYALIADQPAKAGQLGDNRWYVPTADSLIRDGDLDLSNDRLRLPVGTEYGVSSYADGKTISIFPLGTSIIAAPAMIVAHLLHATQWSTAEILAKLLAAGSVVLLFLCLQRLGLSAKGSVLVSLVFAFASSHLSLHAGGLWSHNTSLFISLLYFLLLLSDRPALNLLAAPVAVFGYICRPDFSLLIIAGVAYIWFERRHLLASFLILVGLSAAPFVIWSFATFGSCIPPYYHAERLQLSLGIVGVVAGQLLSPNRGLLIFNPFLLLGIAGGICSCLLPMNHRRLYQILFVVFILHTGAISAFPHWWAGWSFGPRFFAPILGLLFVLTVPLFQSVAGRGRVLRTTVLAFATVTTLWGGFAHYRGATSESAHTWSATPDVDKHPERIWDWKDMQLLH